MDGLRQKLEAQGFTNVQYIVVNHQGASLQHAMLSSRLSSYISLFKQAEDQPDVWQTLNGDKDDFLIYDRCGRLTHHVSLPYSIIGQGHIESAIRDTYCKRVCGDCSHESVDVPEECTRPIEAQQPGTAAADAEQPQAGNTAAEQTPHHHGSHQHGHHHHGHQHHGHHHQLQAPVQAVDLAHAGQQEQQAEMVMQRPVQPAGKM